MMRRWIYLVVWLLVAGVVSSCVRRDLLDPDLSAELRVHLVTEGVNNVTCNIYNEALTPPRLTSEKLRTIVYNAEGNSVLSQGFLSRKSYDERGYEVLSEPVAISSGNYRLVSFNFDVVQTLIDQEGSFETIRASALEIPSNYYTRFGTRADESERIYFQPDHLMVARDAELEIENHVEKKVIDLDAHTVVDTYYLQIRITGAEHMAQQAPPVAYLSGLSPWNYIGENRREESVGSSVYIELQQSTDPRIEGENRDVICALVNTFGKIPDSESELTVTFSVLTRDGQIHQKVVDMRPIFEREEARLYHWLLIDEVWEIPEPIFPDEPGGGFSPEVNDWEDVEDTIAIGPRHKSEQKER